MDANTFLSAYPSYKRKHRQHIVNVQVDLLPLIYLIFIKIFYF